MYWLHSPSKKLCYPLELSFANCMALLPEFSIKKPLSSKFELFSANCMPLMAEFFVKKPWSPEFELIFVNYMPFTGRILYRKGFVIQYVPFFANYQPTSWQNSSKSCNSHMSSFLLITCTSIAYQKDFLTEYELFSANNMLLFGLVHS